MTWPFQAKPSANYPSTKIAYETRTAACDFALQAMAPSLADGEHDFERLFAYAVFFETFIAHGSEKTMLWMDPFNKEAKEAEEQKTSVVLKFVHDAPA